MASHPKRGKRSWEGGVSIPGGERYASVKETGGRARCTPAQRKNGGGLKEGSATGEKKKGGCVKKRRKGRKF